MSVFVHHFEAIGEFKLELQSSYSQEIFNSSQNRCFSVLCELQIWWMTLKNNRALLLCYFQLYASFHSHLWIQSWDTVQKHLILIKINDLFSLVTFEFHRWPWKTTGHLSKPTSSFVHHFAAIGKFKLELQARNAKFGSKSANFLSGVSLKYDGWPWKKERTSSMLLQFLCIISKPYINSNWSYSPENAKLGFDLCDLNLWPLTLKFCMDITSVIGDTPENFMTRWLEHSEKGVPDRQMDGQTDGRTRVFLELLGHS